jgi:hypothetical protein
MVTVGVALILWHIISKWQWKSTTVRDVRSMRSLAPRKMAMLLKNRDFDVKRYVAPQNWVARE